MYVVGTQKNLDLDQNVKVNSQIMYFFVNVSPPKPSDVATSNFVSE